MSRENDLFFVDRAMWPYLPDGAYVEYIDTDKNKKCGYVETIMAGSSMRVGSHENSRWADYISWVVAFADIVSLRKKVVCKCYPENYCLYKQLMMRLDELSAETKALAAEVKTQAAEIKRLGGGISGPGSTSGSGGLGSPRREERPKPPTKLLKTTSVKTISSAPKHKNSFELS